MEIQQAIETLEEVYGRFGPRDAIEPLELDAARCRLGLELPSSLRILYERTGRSAALHGRHNRLMAPEDIVVKQDHLIFYEENQNTCCWGIHVARLGAPEPPVDTSYSKAPGEVGWATEFSSVAEFLCVQGAWQAVYGGLPFVSVVSRILPVGVASLPPNNFGGRISATADRVGKRFVQTKATSAWIIERCVFAFASEDYFGLAGADAKNFLRASECLGMGIDDWDYATLRDDA